MPELPDWYESWAEAQNVWGRPFPFPYPHLFRTEQAAEAGGVKGNIGRIRLSSLEIGLNLPHIQSRGFLPYLHVIFAHEMGHALFCPQNTFQHSRLLKRALAQFSPSNAQLLTNLYEDLILNHHLHTQRELSCIPLLQRMFQSTDSPLWVLMARTYEWLWQRPRFTLLKTDIHADIEDDACLLARWIRQHQTDWQHGFEGFLLIAEPYLVPPLPPLEWRDLNLNEEPTLPLGLGHFPAGGTDKAESKRQHTGPVQYLEPQAYLELFQNLGFRQSKDQLTQHYYWERALPFLFPFRYQQLHAEALMPEGSTDWDWDAPLEDIDWFESVLQSPVVVPGMTTRKQFKIPEPEAKTQPPEYLEIYIDGSGSMPPPGAQFSWLCLAGVVLACSALRQGVKVRVTLWSGADNWFTTPGFTRQESELLKVLVGYIGGETQFPLRLFFERLEENQRLGRQVNQVILTDGEIQNLRLPSNASDLFKQVSVYLGLNIYHDWHLSPAFQALADMGWQLFALGTIEAMQKMNRALCDG